MVREKEEEFRRKEMEPSDIVIFKTRDILSILDVIHLAFSSRKLSNIFRATLNQIIERKTLTTA